MKKCTGRKVIFCIGLTRAAKAGQKSIIQARRVQRTIQGRTPVILSSLRPHSPQFQQSAGATDLYSLSECSLLCFSYRVFLTLSVCGTLSSCYLSGVFLTLNFVLGSAYEVYWLKLSVWNVPHAICLERSSQCLSGMFFTVSVWGIPHIFLLECSLHCLSLVFLTLSV